MGEHKDRMQYQGCKWGRLAYIKCLPPDPEATQKHRRALFQCDCGRQHEAKIAYVKDGRTRSCGCLAQEVRKKGTKKTKRGLSANRRACRECGAATVNYFHCTGCLNHGVASLLAFGASWEAEARGGW